MGCVRWVKVSTQIPVQRELACCWRPVFHNIISEKNRLAAMGESLHSTVSWTIVLLTKGFTLLPLQRELCGKQWPLAYFLLKEKIGTGGKKPKSTLCSSNTGWRLQMLLQISFLKEDSTFQPKSKKTEKVLPHPLNKILNDRYVPMFDTTRFQQLLW